MGTITDNSVSLCGDANARIVASLVDENGRRVTRTDSNGGASSYSGKSDGTGAFSITLANNADIAPANSCYTLWVGGNTYLIQVASGTATVADSLAVDPGALTPPFVPSTKVSKSGDTMTGLLNLPASGMTVADGGGSRSNIYVNSSPTNLLPYLVVRAPTTGTGTYSIFQVRDNPTGAPIAWVLNVGGLAVNDEIGMVDDSGSYIRQVGMCYLTAGTTRKGFALVLGEGGAGGHAYTYGGQSYNTDAGKENYLRADDSNNMRIVAVNENYIFGREDSLVPLSIGRIGPSNEIGIAMGITNDLIVYRSASGVARTNGNLIVDGSVKVGNTHTISNSSGILVVNIGGTDQWQTGGSGTVAPVAARDAAISLGVAATNRWNSLFVSNAVDVNGNKVRDNSGVLVVQIGGVDMWQTGGSGAVAPVAGKDNAIDLGVSGTNRWRTGYFGTSVNIGGNNAMTTATSVLAAQMPALTGDITTSAGAVATTLANTANTRAVISAASLFPARHMSTGNYTTPGGNTTTGAPAANTAVAIPFVPDSSVTLTRIGIYVTATASNAVCRFGIYNDNGGYPGTLILDTGVSPGTTDTHTSTGWKEATISQAVTAGTVYWLVYVAQTAAATVTCINAADYALNVATSSNLNAANTGYSMTGVSGALGTWSNTLAEYGAAPRIAVKC